MSRYCVYINPPDYLTQWLRNQYWNYETNRVEFPRGSAPRAIMQAFLKSTPVNAEGEPSGGLLPIEVPTFRGLKESTHNYLPPAGATALISACKRMFQKQLWDELHVFFEHDVLISDIIYAFMERHGIEDTEKNWETIRQMYARLRKKSLEPTRIEPQLNNVNLG